MCVLAGLGRVPRRTWALLMLLSLGFTLPVRADNLTLAWDPSSDPSATAYKLYYSTTSGTYSNSVSAGANTTATVSGLLPGNTYFFSATALNDAGLESPFSNEVSYTV